MDQTVNHVLGTITLQTGYLVQSNQRTQLFITRPVQYLILSTFVYGPAVNAHLYHIIFHCPCPFHVGRHLHTRRSILAITLARRCQEHAMAGTFTSVCCCEGSLLIGGICTLSRPHCKSLLRAECWWPNNTRAAHPEEYFLGGLRTSGSL